MNRNKFGKQGWAPDRIGNLNGKTYIITGTTSGTGFEAAKILLSKGAKVVMLNRNLKKAAGTIATLEQELGSKVDVLSIQMDLAAQASIKEAAEEVLKKVPKIDALICNAAIAQVPKQKITVDSFESQMGVNHYGNFLLQGLLFPRIEESKGRIVVVGSMGYNMGIKTIQFDDMNWDKNYSPNGVYSQSKLAQIMCVYELQDRLKEAGKTDVKVYACHPGSSRTNLLKVSTDWAKDELFSTPFFILFGILFILASIGFWQLGKTEMARAYIIPTSVAGALLMTIGFGLFFTNKSRITQFETAYNNDASAFVESELKRTEATLKEYQNIVFKAIPLIIVICALVIVFINKPIWRASMITSIAILVVILLIDGTAHARVDAYNQQLLSIEKDTKD